MPPQSRLEQALARRVARAVRQFGLVEPGDRILVALSGGKDYHALLHLLERMRARVPIPFELVAVHLDQNQPGHDTSSLEAYLLGRGFEYHILRVDTYSVVRQMTEPGQTTCFICSRLRRGILYQAAVDLGCSKIALGHHREDVLATLLLNLVFSGQLKAMPPKLVSDDWRNVVIRPLVFCAEQDLAHLSSDMGFPILPCSLCSAQQDHKRDAMMAVLHRIEAENPGALSRMIAGLTHVRPTHLLDTGLWQALGLQGLVKGSSNSGEPGEPVRNRPRQRPAGPGSSQRDHDDSTSEVTGLDAGGSSTIP